MSRGLGKLQAKALELAKDPGALISPIWLAHTVFGSHTDSNIRSARRALLGLAKKRLITDHGFSGGTGVKLYGGPHAQRIQMKLAYDQVMRNMALERVAAARKSAEAVPPAGVTPL